MEFYTKILVGSILFIGVLESIRVVQATQQEKNLSTTTSKEIIYVTTENITEESTTVRPKGKKNKKKIQKEGNVSKEATERNDVRPIHWSFPDFNDQIRQNTNFNYRRPIQTTPPPVLSGKHDTSLTDQEHLQNLNVPATYESIVYNPDTKEATSAFSRSNFWETPELVIKDINQRDDRGNTLITTSSRLEYTPGSVQTPLEEIQYRRPFTQPYRKTTPPPPVYENQREDVRNDEEVEEGDEESENQEVEEDNEEIQEGDESEEEERPVHTYPVNLEAGKSFNPFENVQEPDDIYSDVLNNIGSVFNDEHSSIPVQKPLSNTKEFTPQNVNNLLPQFEQYSFENLQEQERADDGGDDNEELAEYDDSDDEVNESKTVPLQKTSEVRPPSLLVTQKPPQKIRNEERLRESPFPNVKIINEKSEKQVEKPTLKHESSIPFSPWLPTQATYQHKKPTPWPHALPKQENKKPVYQTWPKVAETRQEKTYKLQNNNQEPVYKSWPKGDKTKQDKVYKEPKHSNKPYKESYKTSYNKSWKTSSPEKDENSSYKTTWQSSKPKKENGYEEGRHKERPRKSAKVLQQSSTHVNTIVKKVDPLRGNSGPVFVTPVPSSNDQSTVTN